MPELRIATCVIDRDGEVAETRDEIPVFVPGTGLDAGTATLHVQGAAVWISDVDELVMTLLAAPRVLPTITAEAV